MGARLSLLAPSAPTIALSSYIDILDNIQYVEIINNSRFLKTIKGMDINTGEAIVIKILIKPSNNIASFNINLQHVTELMVKEASLLSQYNYFLPTNQFIETDRAGYLIRQLIRTNLYDRLSIRPFLTPIEKKFMVFQLLKMMETLHSHLKIHHGDIKLENIMVSSSNWILLTDFSSYTKPVYIPDDNPNQFSFYFDTSDRRVCNLAPERFYNAHNEPQIVQNFDDNGNFNGTNHITDEMDLFSLGCSIGELYLDGEPLFTLSGLFKYMKNEYYPDLSGVGDESIKQMISNLILFTPSDRLSASTLLDDSHGTIFPESFYDFLYEFVKDLNNNDSFMVKGSDNNVTSSDLRVDYIYKTFNKIAENLQFDYEKSRGPHKHHHHTIHGMNLNLPGMPNNYRIKPTSYYQDLNDLQSSCLIILNIVFSLISTLKQPESKIKACELIIALSERVNDECKLDRSLPYLCKLIDEYIESSTLRRLDNMKSSMSDTVSNDNGANSKNNFSAKVVVVALDSIVTLLDSCSYITPLNVLMFPEYLLPKLTKPINISTRHADEQLIKSKLAYCIPFLAQTSHRFLMMTVAFKMNSEKHLDPVEITDMNNKNFTIPKDILYTAFEDISVLLLTDPDPKVRASFVSNIGPLCRFFGVDKTNDIILPHLITYLNDTDNELKLAFLNSILTIGPFVGVLSFEQYLFPLLIQTLSDPEQLVVLKVLEIFVKFVAKKIINPKTEFNALSIYKELLSSTTHLFLHPNEWIRQSVLNLVLAINDNLLNADRFCFLYPQIKSFLSYDVTTIDWNTLYPCLTKPLPKIVYQYMLAWAASASEKSLFWKQQNFSRTSSKKLTAFSKDKGKSVFVQSKFGDNSITEPSSVASLTIPLSHDDKQWLLKLKSVGLDEKDYWKLLSIRSYVFQVNNGLSLHSPSGSSNNSELELGMRTIDVTPRNIFFDITYKSEPIATATKGLETSVSAIDSGNGDNFSIKTDRSGSNSLILPTISRVSASIQTVEENVFGELELNNGGSRHNKKLNGSMKTSKESSSMSHKVISSNDDKVIIANSRHSYLGHNPYILHYLETVKFDLSLDSFSEFGDTIKIHNPKSPDWKPTGECISQINASSGPGIPDSLTCVSVNPSSEFFITGSESGFLRVWDCQKLGKNIMFKNASLSMNLKASIEKICFMNNRNVFAVATRDGKVRIFRVVLTRGESKKIVKYSKLTVIRKYNLQNNEYATSIQFHFDGSINLLIVATSSSRIIGINIITMKCEFTLQNPLVHGIPTCVMSNSRKGWLVVGTSKGRFCLWDTRFLIMVKCWKIYTKEHRNVTSAIKQMILLPSEFKLPDNNSQDSYFAVIGGTSESDITIWDMPDLECREVLCSYTENPQVKQYVSEEIKEDSNSLNEILDSLMDHEVVAEKRIQSSMILYKHINGLYLVNSIEQGRIILWKLNELEKSMSQNHYSFTRTSLNQKQGLTYEKKMEKHKDSTITSYNQDVINGLGMISVPYEMIVTVDRSGLINIFT